MNTQTLKAPVTSASGHFGLTHTGKLDFFFYKTKCWVHYETVQKSKWHVRLERNSSLLSRCYLHYCVKKQTEKKLPLKHKMNENEVQATLSYMCSSSARAQHLLCTGAWALVHFSRCADAQYLCTVTPTGVQAPCHLLLTQDLHDYSQDYTYVHGQSSS